MKPLNYYIYAILYNRLDSKKEFFLKVGWSTNPIGRENQIIELGEPVYLFYRLCDNKEHALILEDIMKLAIAQINFSGGSKEYGIQKIGNLHKVLTVLYDNFGEVINYLPCPKVFGLEMLREGVSWPEAKRIEKVLVQNVNL